MEPAALLELWDRHISATPAEKGAALLRHVGHDPADVSIGKREALLLDFHGRLFGSNLTAIVKCQNCNQALEVNVPGQQIAEASGEMQEFDLLQDGINLRVRTLSALDIAQASRCASLGGSALQLLESAIVSASQDGVVQTVCDLPVSVHEAVSEALATADPLSEIRLDVSCDECGRESSTVFDPPSYIWAKLDHWARRMLTEVHSIAIHYGWCETEILKLSPQRRTAYLELISS